jgi:hypothetical protein
MLHQARSKSKKSHPRNEATPARTKPCGPLVPMLLPRYVRPYQRQQIRPLSLAFNRREELCYDR